MTKPTEHQLNLINDVIQEFKFEKVHIAMTALDWKWIAPIGAITDNSMAIPTIARLKQSATQLLIKLRVGAQHQVDSLLSILIPVKNPKVLF